MIETGAVVRATVNRVEAYGVYLTSNGDKILVLAPEVSWRSGGELRDRFRVGDSLDVFVVRFNDETGEFLGSLRRLHPEENPYRELSRLASGTVLPARIIQSIGDEVTVSLENEAWGRIPRATFQSTPKAGERIDVVITGVDADEGRLWLEPALGVSRGSNGPVGPWPTTSSMSSDRKDLK